MSISHSHQQRLPTHITDPYNQQEAFLVGIVTFGVFFVLNFYFKEKYNIPLKNDEIGARICSLIHGVLSTFGCTYALFTHDGGWFDSNATRMEANWMMFSCAYFTVDTVIMLLWKVDYMYLAHHAVTMTCCGFPALSGQYGFAVCCATLGGEITNPLMHGRWLLHANGQADSKLCRWLTWAWFFIFFVARFGFGPWVVHNMTMNLPVAVAPLCYGILIFSWKMYIDAVKSERKGEWWTG